MAQSVVDRAWRATTPDEIEPDLAALWRDIAKERPIARAVMSNLVVVRERAAARADEPLTPLTIIELARDLPLEDVVARHPSRVILIQHDRSPQTVCAPFAVSVGVMTFGPPEARYGVEEIIVQSACAEQSLPSIVRRLLRGDVPTSVWWTEDVSQTPPLHALVSMARQFVYDSRDWQDTRCGVLALAPLINAGQARLDLADVNWRKLTPLRHALLHAGGAADLDHLRQGHVDIFYRAGDEALAWLAVGWLAARLEWAPETTPRVEETRDDDETLSIAVGPDLTVALNDHRVLVTRRDAPGFTVSVPQEDGADAVAAELRNLGHDACLRDALRALVARFSR
ncbi:MAG TPA: glucose-6-phosphate dehydrogenase assembly protein OpcA [Vicinamibacterales bacterium]|jgi:glucose-6-phosphate dehydrogenase assembly protein OpcA|nr:glucose-6-phosphate dehydrogenase assembly protein OpcA [Vicinamibacterales bacterium]